jgi:inorganic triphosphatase YgiF
LLPTNTCPRCHELLRTYSQHIRDRSELMTKQLAAIEENRYAAVAELDQQLQATEKVGEEVWQMLKNHRNQAHADESAGKNAVG